MNQINNEPLVHTNKMSKMKKKKIREKLRGKKNLKPVNEGNTREEC